MDKLQALRKVIEDARMLSLLPEAKNLRQSLEEFDKSDQYVWVDAGSFTGNRYVRISYSRLLEHDL